MQNNLLEKLDEKVSQLLEQLRVLKEENENLRNENIALKSDKELKEMEIQRLNEQNLQKDLEIEEIVQKIEGILGKDE